MWQNIHLRKCQLWILHRNPDSINKLQKSFLILTHLDFQNSVSERRAHQIKVVVWSISKIKLTLENFSKRWYQTRITGNRCCWCLSRFYEVRIWCWFFSIWVTLNEILASVNRQHRYALLQKKSISKLHGIANFRGKAMLWKPIFSTYWLLRLYNTL